MTMGQTPPAVKAGQPAKPTLSGFETNLAQHLRAGYQILYVHTSEEKRAEQSILRAAASAQHQVVTWDVVNGFCPTGPQGMQDVLIRACPEAFSAAEFRKPAAALNAIVGTKVFPPQKIVFIFRDLDDFWREPEVTVRRTLKGFSEQAMLRDADCSHPVIILSAKLAIHPKLTSNIATLEFDLPDDNDLGLIFDATLAAVNAGSGLASQAIQAAAKPLRYDTIAALRGLTSAEAENCLSRCIVKHSGYAPEMLTTIREEKAEIVKKDGILTYIPEATVASREEVGGYDEFFKWIDNRRLAAAPDAVEAKIDFPKGCILIGVPGSGKTYTAKMCCRLFNLPGYLFDVGRVFSKWVGESEQRIRDVIKTIEAQRGAVLVVNEADKVFSGVGNNQESSGAAKNVFGTFIDWLSERKSQTFVMMTMNRTTGLPPELLRAGRFDKIFWSDLPNAFERKTIMDIHFRKRGVDPQALAFDKGDWKALIDKTNDFVGAELEQLVIDSRYLSWANGKRTVPTFEELIEAAGAIRPVARHDEEGVKAIREFCRTRFTPVSSGLLAPAGKTAGRNIDLS